MVYNENRNERGENMKKQNKLMIAVILIAILLMGIGYASLSNSILLINGKAFATANQENFKVYFTGEVPKEHTSESYITVQAEAVAKSQEATVNILGLNKKGDYGYAILEIENGSQDIDSEITVTADIGESEMFNINVIMCDQEGTANQNYFVASGQKTYVKIMAELLKTPTSNEKATITAKVTAVPTEAEDQPDIPPQGEVISDSIIIPDKYNTGAKGALETIPEEDWKVDEEGSMVILSRSTTHDINIKATKKEEIVVENKNFNKSLRFLNDDGLTVNRKIIFRNCKFKSVSSGRIGYDKLELIFENCSFTHYFGSNASFDHCYFGGSVADGINPFQNITVKNCFFSDLAIPSTEPVENKLHSDGTQMYGYSGTYKNEEITLDVQNILFYNCRMEVPPIRYTNSAGYVNAALMIQPEYADLHDVKFEKCIINGGGFSIYISAKNNCIVRDLTLQDIKVGCSALYGELYKGSVAVPESLFEERNIIYNTSKTDKLYVGSVWKEEDGVHISVSNDTSTERTLTVELGNGTRKEFTIKACYPGTTWWNSQDKFIEESVDKYNYEDFPFDIELVVEDTTSIRCYDGETLIRSQKLS